MARTAAGAYLKQREELGWPLLKSAPIPEAAAAPRG
jgi:hypothetical protein